MGPEWEAGNTPFRGPAHHFPQNRPDPALDQVWVDAFDHPIAAKRALEAKASNPHDPADPMHAPQENPTPRLDSALRRPHRALPTVVEDLPTRSASKPYQTIRNWTLAAFALCCFASCGTSRILRVTSEPSGALVRLDEDVIGTTPLEHEFKHFGKRRLSLYLPGYQSHSQSIHMKAPWHARFPIDVVTEVILPLGFKYDRGWHVQLEPDDGRRVLESLDTFVQRAEELRRGLPGQAPPTEAAATDLEGNPVPLSSNAPDGAATDSDR